MRRVLPGSSFSCSFYLTCRFHEAGYDALVTGRCFLALANRLGTHSASEGPRNGRVMPSSPLVQPFVNKMFLMRIQVSPVLLPVGVTFLETVHLFL